MDALNAMILKRLAFGSDSACGLYRYLNANKVEASYQDVTQALTTLQTDGLVSSLGAIGYTVTDAGVKAAKE
jgi:DNA-binding PadR family transcriptional regulator